MTKVPTQPPLTTHQQERLEIKVDGRPQQIVFAVAQAKNVAQLATRDQS